MSEEPNQLVSTNKLIQLAKTAGIDLGAGNPKERIRYYTKLGLIPHAQRKKLQGKPGAAVGCYPLWVLERLKWLSLIHI